MRAHLAVFAGTSRRPGLPTSIHLIVRRGGASSLCIRTLAGDDEIPVVQSASTTFNPQLSQKTLAAQHAADPTSAISEWDAEFRSDISTYLDDELIEAAIDYARRKNRVRPGFLIRT